VLISFLLLILQTALTTIPVNQSATALLVRTIATVKEAIAGTETEIGTEIVEGEIETSAIVIPTVATAKGTATGTVNVAAIGRKAARAMRKNADESRVKTTAGVPKARATKRAAPRAVRVVAAVVSATAVLLIAARPRPWAPSCSHSANVRQAVGMSMLRGTSSTRLCRRNKLVRIVLVGRGRGSADGNAS
jgi:hypothetical protein